MTGIERLVDIVTDGPYSGGMIHISVQKLREICEQIEREQDASVKDSSYDAILTEDRDTIAWVRAYGGIEKVKQDALCWNTAENIAQTTLDWLARVCPVAGIEKCGYGVSLEKLEDAIKRRLMPEGMEWILEVWPKWSNGEYCKFGDWWTAKRYGDYEPRKLLRLVIYTPEQLSEWGQGDGESYGYEWDFMRPSEVGYRPDKADQPSPQIIAADGEPLEVGQTVWTVDAGIKFEVHSIEGDTVWGSLDGDRADDGLGPKSLTHQRPVLDADGVPTCEGDTVWWLEHTIAFTVVSQHETHDNAGHELECGHTVEIAREGHEPHMYVHPESLHHTKPEPPDSAERIADDIMRMVDEWCSYPTLREASEKAANSVGEATMGAALRSLSKRCRAMDERERGE